MLEINFVYGINNKLLEACKIINFLYLKKFRIVILFDENNLLDEFDNYLWSFSDISFIPHIVLSDNFNKKIPIILTNDVSKLSIVKEISKNYPVILNLSEYAYDNLNSYQKLFEIVTKKQADIFNARKKWREYRKFKYQINSYHRNYCTS